MGHACTILTFPEKISKYEITKRCGRWATCNCDLEERGGFGYDYLDIRFTDKVFDSYDEASEYLEGTFGNYREIAVRYKQYPKMEPNKTMVSLQNRIKEYEDRIREIEKPHWATTSYEKIRCSNCGSTLATNYCGKSYNNYCPVCKADLRPKSLLDRMEKYIQTVNDLKEKLKAEQKKQNMKMASKAEYMWAVACEVHC